jgi:hypothetical protein
MFTFQILTAVTVNSTIFLEVKLYCLEEVHWITTQYILQGITVTAVRSSNPTNPAFLLNAALNSKPFELEVLTVVFTWIPIFLDMISCSPIKINRHFGGTCPLHDDITLW